MNIAILGANGIIGHAVYTIIRDRHNVTTMGRGREYDVNLDLLEYENFSPDLFKGFDALIHCAGVINEDFASPSIGFTKGTTAAKYLAESAHKAGVRTFIYVSSAHVYGTLSGKIDETLNCNPLSDYAISHLATEQIFKRLAISSDTRTLILRPCATYGEIPHPEKFVRWSLVPFNLPNQAVKSGGITLTPGSDRIKRNFISANSIGLHIRDFLDNPSASQFGNCTIINPLGEDNLSIYEFAQRCASVYQEITHEFCPIKISEGTLPPELSGTGIYVDKRPPAARTKSATISDCHH